MILQCILNKIENMDAPYEEYISEYIHQTEVDLGIGEKYVVYGITFRANIPWFYICEEESDDYPRPHFCGFFKVIDAKVSSLWKIYYSSLEKNISNILPEIWGDNLSFYENLVEGNEFETATFQKLKISIDKEAFS